MDNPLVSFILLSYNNEKFIAAALESVLSQDYDPIEYVVIDDASSDQSVAEIEKIIDVSERSVTLIKNKKNLGVAASYNLALSRTTGDFIAHMGGDDISEPCRITSQIGKIKASTASMVVSSLQIIDANNALLDGCATPSAKRLQLSYALNTASIGLSSAPSMLYHRNIIDVFGAIPESLSSEDEALAFRAILQGGIDIIQEPLVRYRVHDDSITGKTRSKTYFEYLEWLVDRDIASRINNKKHWIDCMAFTHHRYNLAEIEAYLWRQNKLSTRLHLILTGNLVERCVLVCYFILLDSEFRRVTHAFLRAKGGRLKRSIQSVLRLFRNKHEASHTN